jgi:hypothetical protein
MRVFVSMGRIFKRRHMETSIKHSYLPAQPYINHTTIIFVLQSGFSLTQFLQKISKSQVSMYALEGGKLLVRERAT